MGWVPRRTRRSGTFKRGSDHNRGHGDHVFAFSPRTDVPDKAAVIHTSEAKTHLPSGAARLLRVATVGLWFF